MCSDPANRHAGATIRDGSAWTHLSLAPKWPEVRTSTCRRARPRGARIRRTGTPAWPSSTVLR